MKNVLIIGGLGYIGIHLFDKIYARYPDCIIVTHDFDKETEYYSTEYTRMDYLRMSSSLNFGGFAKYCDEFDVVYLLAATSNVVEGNKSPFSLYDNNVRLVLDVLNMIRSGKIKTRKLIFTSSGAVYQNQLIDMQEDSPLANRPDISTYGFSKIVGEELINKFDYEYGLNHVVLRLANVAGEMRPSWENHVPETHLIPCLLDIDRQMIIWNNGLDVRDYIHVDDVTEALILAASVNLCRGTYNIGTGIGTSTDELVQKIRPDLNNIQYHPYSREGDLNRIVLDSKAFTMITGWKPRNTIDDIIKSYWSHLSDGEKQ